MGSEAGRTVNCSKFSHPSAWRKQKTERAWGGGGNSGPECSLFQSAGKSDKEVSLGTMGMEDGGGTGPIHTGHKGYGPGGMQAGCGAGPGSKVPE